MLTAASPLLQGLNAAPLPEPTGSMHKTAWPAAGIAQRAHVQQRFTLTAAIAAGL